MKYFSTIIITFALSACGSIPKPGFVPTAVHYNTVVEDTNNELLLMNIIRAKHGRPMYFTRISALRSNFTLGGEIGLTTSIPGQDLTETITNTNSPDGLTTAVASEVSRGVNSFNPNLSASYSTEPGFDYQILDSQTFQRGIQTPITASQIAHYLLQGWPADLVASLVVESVTITTGSDSDVASDKSDSDVKRTFVIVNDPDSINAEPNRAWREFLDCTDIIGAERNASVTQFENITRSDIKSIDNLDLFNSNRWGFPGDQVDGTVATLNLSRPRSNTIGFRKDKDCSLFKTAIDSKIIDGNTLALSDGEELDDRIGELTIPEQSAIQLLGRFPSEETIIDVVTLESNQGHLRDDARGLFAGSADQPIRFKVDGGATISVVTRSIQGVIYYLGECMRRPDACSLGTSSQSDKVLNVSKGRPSNGCRINQVARIYGEEYWLPKIQTSDCDFDLGRTWQTLTFVNQMLNLQKASTIAPSTTTIRTVN